MWSQLLPHGHLCEPHGRAKITFVTNDSCIFDIVPQWYHFCNYVSEVEKTSTSNPQPPSKNEIELKEKEATQKKRLKEVKIATRRHKIPLPHNAT